MPVTVYGGFGKKGSHTFKKRRSDSIYTRGHTAALAEVYTKYKLR
jgi:hypothetical protein